jgi:hypothetical protein
MVIENVNGRSCRFRRGLTAIRGSLICALVVLFVDVILDGGYVFSAVVCPIWFLVGVIRAATQRSRQPVGPAVVLIPLATGLLVAVNYHVQTGIATANARSLIQACERYRVVNGNYPERLADLVPRYLDSVPRAKCCCLRNDFSYYASAGGHTLSWCDVPPFGRRVYNFETGEWRDIR